MASYITAVKTDKQYTGNVVILINGQYFAIRQPDSGLVIASPYDKCVADLVLNPTTVDIRRVNTTIASYSFKLLDKNGVISAIVLGDASGLAKKPVRIWLGRSNLTSNASKNMAFSDYYELPNTKVNKLSHSDNSYSITSTEEIERMAKPIFNATSVLAVDILAATTTFQMRDDISNFPASGFLKLENEFVSYSAKDNALKQFSGIIRGEFGSTPADHNANSPCYHAQRIVDNPLNIFLKLLISGGGGGTYDTLQSGLGISNTLIDIAGIESIRDLQFLGQQYSLTFYNIDSALKYIEKEILQPNNLRLTNSQGAKITLALLDKAVFVDDIDVIDEDSVTKFPSWSVDSTKVTNQVIVNWDFDEGTNQYLKKTELTDAASIALYGAQPPLEYNFKGPQSSLNGAALVDDYCTHLITRLSVPTPEIAVSTHVSKSLQNIGDKAAVNSSKIPANDGTLNFASDLEIISKALNFKTGDVSMKLAFTSFTNIRSCYLAPSDNIQSVTSQKVFTLPAGRGAFYQVGWVMRLWKNDGTGYQADPNNIIESITGDTITMANNFTTVLSGPDIFRLKFCDYDEATSSQKRYCFISQNGNNFDDGKQTYKVTY